MIVVKKKDNEEHKSADDEDEAFTDQSKTEWNAFNNNGQQDMALLRECARQEKQRIIHHLAAGNAYPLYYTKDFDELGILYFLGTDWRQAPWKNPAEMGVVTVTSSRLAKGT